jgi:hypothetical protein
MSAPGSFLPEDPFFAAARRRRLSRAQRGTVVRRNTVVIPNGVRDLLFILGCLAATILLAWLIVSC